MKGLKIVLNFAPMLIDVVGQFGKALRKDSPGGKKVTPEEWEAISTSFADAMRDKMLANPKAMIQMLDLDDELDVSDVLASLE